MKRFLTFYALIATVSIHGQNVGIGTTSPLARLHVTDSSVLFSGPTFLPDTANGPPTSGWGNRMMWYADRAAFRVGGVTGTEWDKEHVGSYSVACGYQAKASGNYSISLGNYSVASGNDSRAIGTVVTAIGPYSTAIGHGAQAYGESSMAMGYNATTYGFGSTAIGGFTTASGTLSIAMGESTVASANFSTAMGAHTSATGLYSLATGWHTVSKTLGSASMGMFNDDQDYTPELPQPTDRIFQIGNGDFTIRRNAFTILRNGHIGIGVTQPTLPLTFEAQYGGKISLFGNSSNYGFGVKLGMLQIHGNNVQDTIAFGYGSHSSFSKTMWIKGDGNAWLKGTLTQASDKRLKKGIRPIDNALTRVSQLNGYNYYWNDLTSDQSLQSGLLAQEVEKVFPELVSKNSDGMLSVNYSGLIPVLIQSIKEQQKEIAELKTKVDELRKRRQ